MPRGELRGQLVASRRRILQPLQPAACCLCRFLEHLGEVLRGGGGTAQPRQTARRRCCGRCALLRRAALCARALHSAPAP